MTYTEFASLDELHAFLAKTCTVENGVIIAVRDEKALEHEAIVQIQYTASVHADETIKQGAIQAINEIAELMNISTGSNATLYDEKAAGEHQFFTVPAMNCRMLTFHMVRSAVRAASALSMPHIVFELALTEGAYTGQPMNEYVALVKAAYISLGRSGDVIYVQADHYRLDPKKYAADPGAEVERMSKAIQDAIECGVYNIDIDTSMFETDDPNKSDEENQRENARLTATLFHFIRKYEKEHDLPHVISIGGEVGEVGGENTKYPQVNAYLKLLHEYATELGSGDAKGLSKVSINVGSVHGGALGPDGKPLDTVPLDFQAHHDLFMKGKDPMSPGKHVVTVQHGASTLPKKYFPLFPAVHTGEIHLATGFQNIVWDVLKAHDAGLYEEMKKRVFDTFGENVAKHDTEAVGFMKERKRVTQFFKKQLLESPALVHVEPALEKEFTTLFHSLYTLLAPKKKGIVVDGDRDD